MSSDNKSELFIKIAYFTSLAGASLLLGFGVTINRLKKSIPETPEAALYDEGVSLARKALMRGTIYSICGFGILSVGAYKIFGAKMIENFKSKAKNNDEQDIKYLQNLLGISRTDLISPESSLERPKK